MKDAKNYRLGKREKPKKTKNSQSGFSLVEVIIAMIIFLVAVTGVFATFTYAVNYNSGNNSRAQALAILRQEVELIRSAKFTQTVPKTTSTGDDAKLLGGTKTAKSVTASDGSKYIVQIVVDDDPFTAGVQVDTTKTLKEISVTITLDKPTPGWQSSQPATVILRRTRSN